MKRDVSHRRAARGGFTLIEIMVALTILALGIVAVVQLFPRGLEQSRIAQERQVVASLAKTELGRVKVGGVGDPLVEWAEQNALRQLGLTERAYSLYEGWRSSVQRLGGNVGGGDVELYRVSFFVRMTDGRDEKFVTYVTPE